MPGPLQQADKQDRDLMMDKSLIPSNPYEIAASKDIVRRHIQNGDITQDDIDLLKSSYGMAYTAALLGSSFMGVGTYFYMKRRAPGWGLGPRLLLAGGMGMVGNFIGFAVGGVGAAIEVNNRMVDAPRKMQIFAEITLESKKAIEEARTQGFPERRPVGRDDSAWDAEGNNERKREEDREKGLQNEIGRIEGDSSNTESGSSIASKIKEQTGDAWDRLRHGEKPKAGRFDQASDPAASVGAYGLGSRLGKEERELRSGESEEAKLANGEQEDPRSQAQREFDALLERERRGEADTDVWR